MRISRASTRSSTHRSLPAKRVRSTSHISHDLTWRLLLAFGAIPALAVFQMRRHLAETPRYRLAAARHKEAKVSFAEGFHALWQRQDLRLRLLGASLT
jgi:MFS transporter, PHS family, inorganic phosphate transporter